MAPSDIDCMHVPQSPSPPRTQIGSGPRAVRKSGMTIKDSAGRKLYAYLDGQGRVMVRPCGNTKTNKARHPGMQRAVVAFRLVLWLAWGTPFEGAEACHFACDHHGCMNPVHGRWGTHAENMAELEVLKEFKTALQCLPPNQRAAFVESDHPAHPLLFNQGFWAR